MPEWSFGGIGVGHIPYTAALDEAAKGTAAQSSGGSTEPAKQWLVDSGAAQSIVPRAKEALTLTKEQFENNLDALEFSLDAEDESWVDSLIPAGEHSGKGFPDPGFPVTGRYLAS